MSLFGRIVNALAHFAGDTGDTSLESIVIHDIITVEANAQAFHDGKPVVLGTFSEGGKQGRLVALADDSALAKDLGF